MSGQLPARLLALALVGTMLSPLPAMAKHSSSSSQNSDPSDPIVATVNGDAIHRSEVQAVLRQILPPGQEATPADIQKVYPQIIGDLISRKLAYQEAIREGLQNQKEVKLAESLSDQQIIEQAFFDKVGKPALTDDKLRQAYDDAIKKQGQQDEVHARHIVVKTEDEAKDIIKQLDGGADFEKLAKEKSLDKNNAKDGGDLGYFLKGSFDPAFTDAAFAMQPNTYSKTPVKTAFGWHVIQVLDKRPAKVPTFDEAKAQLRNRVAHDAIQARLLELSKTAKITVYNPDGSPLKPPSAAPSTPAGSPPSGSDGDTSPGSTPSGAPATAPAPASGGVAPLQLPQTAPNQ
jgi:peptidyl-prolyl cis-trans isomerase C